MEMIEDAQLCRQWDGEDCICTHDAGHSGEHFCFYCNYSWTSKVPVTMAGV